MPAPRLYTIPSEQPNAFATGRKPQHALMEASDGVPDPADLPRLIDRLEHALSVVEAAGSPAGPMLRRAISAAYQVRSGQPNTVRTLAARLLRLQQWAAEQDLRGFD